MRSEGIVNALASLMGGTGKAVAVGRGRRARLCKGGGWMWLVVGV